MINLNLEKSQIMKKGCSILFLCFILLLSSCSNNRTAEYKEKYFSNKDDFFKIAELVIQHYKSNNLQNEVSIWCSKDETEVFYKNLLSNEPEPVINHAFQQGELDDICNFINGSRYEYISINEKFVELGNSTGSMFMYFCLTNEKPEKFSKHHKMYSFGDGWYFAISITR